MLGRVKTSTLLAIAGGAGIALGSMAMLLGKESTKFANQAVFVKTALDFVEKEPEILDMIGQPYALGQPKVMDLWTKIDINNVKVRVPVKGPNDTAFIYAFARKKDRKDRLKLFKIEMTFNKIPGKKMILFDVEDKGTEHDVLSPDPQKEAPKKKDSPIPEGLIPEIDPNKPRRVPKAVLRHRAEKASQSGSETETKSGSSSSSTTTTTKIDESNQSKADEKHTNS